MTDGYDWEVIEALSEEIRQAIQRKKRKENERDERRRNCPRCNPTVKAMERVRDQWTVAGIE